MTDVLYFCESASTELKDQLARVQARSGLTEAWIESTGVRYSTQTTCVSLLEDTENIPCSLNLVTRLRLWWRIGRFRGWVLVTRDMNLFSAVCEACVARRGVYVVADNGSLIPGLTFIEKVRQDPHAALCSVQ